MESNRQRPTGVPRPPGPPRYRLRVSKQFGERLREVILGKGYANPTEFARAAGIHPSTISKWLSGGEKPTLRKLEPVARLLEMDVDVLMRWAYPVGPSSQTEPETTPADTTPELAVELARMLSPRSPLTDEERSQLALLVDTSMRHYRPAMRRRRRMDTA